MVAQAAENLLKDELAVTPENTKKSCERATQ